jgi:hypothetical protein
MALRVHPLLGLVHTAPGGTSWANRDDGRRRGRDVPDGRIRLLFPRLVVSIQIQVNKTSGGDDGPTTFFILSD